MVDMHKVRREDIRWQILLTLNNARPIGAYEELVLSVIRSTYPDATPLELRRELDYLESRDLVKVFTDPLGQVSSDLTRFGIDIAEYTVAVEPGIARPPKA